MNNLGLPDTHIGICEYFGLAEDGCVDSNTEKIAEALVRAFVAGQQRPNQVNRPDAFCETCGFDGLYNQFNFCPDCGRKL